MRTFRKYLALSLAVVMTLAACGDDDATTESTSVSTTASTAAALTTISEPTTTTSTVAEQASSTTEAAAAEDGGPLTADEVIAQHQIPLPPGIRLISVEEQEGGFLVAARVEEPPAAGYSDRLPAAGWTILEVNVLDSQTGSETVVAIAEAHCLVAVVNNAGNFPSSYWIYFQIYEDSTAADCVAAATEALSSLTKLDQP